MTKLLIKTTGIDFSYSKGRNDISNLNLEVPQGSIYGFLGPNGSGKTTTIRILLGLLKPKKGTVYLFDKEFVSNRVSSLDKLGALVETPSLYENLTAFENLKVAAYLKNCFDKNEALKLLEKVKLDAVAHKRVKTFSLGMKQRLGIAIALLNNPKLIILDEPTNGLDPEGITEMRTFLKELNTIDGITIFISSHLLSEIEKTCTHIGILQEGKLVFQGSLETLKKTQNDSVQIEVEVNDIETTTKYLKDKNVSFTNSTSNIMIIDLKGKDEIPNLMQNLKDAGITVYQFTIKNQLEDLFINLTKKNK